MISLTILLTIWRITDKGVSITIHRTFDDRTDFSGGSTPLEQMTKKEKEEYYKIMDEYAGSSEDAKKNFDAMQEELQKEMNIDYTGTEDEEDK